MAIDIRWPQPQMPQAPAPPHVGGLSPTPSQTNGALPSARSVARPLAVPSGSPPPLVRRRSQRQSLPLPTPSEETRPKVRYNAMATWRHSAADSAE